MTLSQRLAEYISACFTGLWVQSHEHDDALAEIAGLCREQEWKLAVWDIASGLRFPGQGNQADAGNSDPLAASGLKMKSHVLGPLGKRDRRARGERRKGDRLAKRLCEFHKKGTFYLFASGEHPRTRRTFLTPQVLVTKRRTLISLDSAKSCENPIAAYPFTPAPAMVVLRPSAKQVTYRGMTKCLSPKQVQVLIEAAVAPLRTRVAAVEAENAQLKAEVARLKENSSTSSKPPSSDIIKPPRPTPAEGKRKKPRRGGQPGHDRHLRQAFSPEQVDYAYTYEMPDLGPEWEPLDEFRTLQQVEPVKKLFEVTEYRARLYRDRPLKTDTSVYRLCTRNKRAFPPRQIRILGIIGLSPAHNQPTVDLEALRECRFSSAARQACMRARGWDNTDN